MDYARVVERLATILSKDVVAGFSLTAAQPRSEKDLT